MAVFRNKSFAVYGMHGIIYRNRILRALSVLNGIERIRLSFLSMHLSVSYDPELCSEDEIADTVKSAGGFDLEPINDISDTVRSAALIRHKKRATHFLLFNFFAALLLQFFTLAPVWGLCISDDAFLCVLPQPLILLCMIYTDRSSLYRGLRGAFRMLPGPEFLLDCTLFVLIFYSIIMMHLIPSGMSADLLGEGFSFKFHIAGWLLFTGSLFYFTATSVRTFLFSKVASIAGNMAELRVLRLKKEAGIFYEKKCHDFQAMKDSDFEEINADAAEVGDIVKQGKGSVIGVDGVVIAGSAHVDESLITGNRIAVKKTEGCRILCGSRITYGSLIIRVANKGNNSVLSRLVSLMDDSGYRQSPSGRMLDKCTMYLIWGSLIIAAFTALLHINAGAAPSYIVSAVAAVLSAASPAAFLSSVPGVNLILISRAACMGIMFRSSAGLENLSGSDMIVFSESNVLTESEYSVVRFERSRKNEFSVIDTLQIIRALELHSTHCIGSSLVGFIDNVRSRVLAFVDEECRERLKAIEALPAANVTEYPGLGVSGSINGRTYYIGTSCFVQKIVPSLRLQKEYLCRFDKFGLTAVHLFDEDGVIVTIALTGRVNHVAADIMSCAHTLGIRGVLLSFDSFNVVSRIAAEANVDICKSGFMPKDKRLLIDMLQRKGNTVSTVCMGNDYAELGVISDVSVVMTDIPDAGDAKADVVLLYSNTADLIPALAFSAMSVRFSLRNTFTAVVFNIISLMLFSGLIVHEAVMPVAAAFVSLGALSLVYLNIIRLMSPELCLRYAPGNEIRIDPEHKRCSFRFDGNAAFMTVDLDGKVNRHKELRRESESLINSDIYSCFDVKECKNCKSGVQRFNDVNLSKEAHEAEKNKSVAHSCNIMYYKLTEEIIREESIHDSEFTSPFRKAPEGRRVAGAGDFADVHIPAECIACSSFRPFVRKRDEEEESISFRKE